MRAIKNTRIVDYLWMNGIKPVYERYGVSYYKCSKKLNSIMDRYYIEYTLLPNRLGSY